MRVAAEAVNRLPLFVLDVFAPLQSDPRAQRTSI